MSEQSAMWWVAHVIIVSAPVQRFGFLRLGLDLGSGFGPVGTGDLGLGLGLDNNLHITNLLILNIKKNHSFLYLSSYPYVLLVV